MAHALLPEGHPCSHCEARNIALCGVLEAGDLAALRCLGGTQHLRAGEPLFHEGDIAGHVYTLTRGALRLTRLLPDGRRQVVGFLFAGDFLGLTLEEEHEFTAEALRETELCRFPRERFDGFVAEQPLLGRQLYRRAAHELQVARSQLLLLGRKSAAERFASFLLELAVREERLGGKPVRAVDLPMSRADIADYLALTKETISRLLAQFRVLRLVRLETLTRVELLDRAGLKALADGIDQALAA